MEPYGPSSMVEPTHAPAAVEAWRHADFHSAPAHAAAAAPLPANRLRRSSASMHERGHEPDGKVYGGGGFFAFALQHSSHPASPAGVHPPPPSHDNKAAGDEFPVPPSPDDIMQRVHDNSLNAAAEALSSFSLMTECGARWQHSKPPAAFPAAAVEQQQQQPPQHAFLPRGQHGGGGHMMQPRAQSWPPFGSHMH